MSGVKGVWIYPINLNIDLRGSLIELWREDDFLIPTPKMGYISYTVPGMSRGPHEHVTQTDIFIFIDGVYKLYLWDNRPESLGSLKEVHIVGKDNKVKVVVPPGVVHGYKNIGNSPAFVLNFPDALYRGFGKEEEVDEIRYEEEQDSIFRID